MSWNGISSRSCARVATSSSAASLLLRSGISTCLSLPSWKTPHQRVISSRFFSWCFFSFFLDSSPMAFRRCSSARLALTSRSSLALTSLSSSSLARPASTRSPNSFSRSSRSCWRFLVASMSRLYCSQSFVMLSSLLEAFIRCSMLRSSFRSWRTWSSSCSACWRSCCFSCCSFWMISRMSSTPSSLLSVMKWSFPTRRSSACILSFVRSSSDSFFDILSMFALSSSARAVTPAMFFCSASWALSTPYRRCWHAWCLSSISRVCSASSASRCCLRVLSSLRVVRSFSTWFSLSSCFFSSCSCSTPPNSTRPWDPMLCTLMFPFGEMTSPSRVTTRGVSPCFRASRYAICFASCRESTMTVPCSMNSSALLMCAGPSACQRGWRARNLSFWWMQAVARRRAWWPCVSRCRFPVLGSAILSSGRKTSVEIFFALRYHTHSRPTAASLTMNASDILPIDICRARSNRFCVGSTSSLMRPRTPSGKAFRNSSATFCRASTWSSRSLRALAASTWKSSERCSSMRESLNIINFFTSSLTKATCCLRCSNCVVSLSSSCSKLLF
mmetsp:Transcript_35937/g.101170  ORF Transcript_35937/g.101170 Transcript_35937/m.101170 type:complete len:558 (+) Transcript_35937:1042-2715(+)